MEAAGRCAAGRRLGRGLGRGRRGRVLRGNPKDPTDEDAELLDPHCLGLVLGLLHPCVAASVSRGCRAAAPRPRATELRGAADVRWAAEHAGLPLGPALAPKLARCLAAKGLLEELKEVWELGGAVDFRQVFEAAAGGGHVPVLRWARGVCLPDYECRNVIYEAAARGGHADVMDWRIWPAEAWIPSRAAAAAAGAGHLEVLEVLPYEVDMVSAMVAAAGSGRVVIMEWVKQRCAMTGEHLDVRLPLCIAAAGGGHIEALQWALDNGYPCGDEAVRAAVAGGHKETRDLLLSRGLSLNQDDDFGGLIREVVSKGHIEMLQWLDLQDNDYTDLPGLAVEHGQPELLALAATSWKDWYSSHEKLSNEAAERGDIGMLRTLQAMEGFKWGDTVCESLAAAGNLEALRWAIGAGAPYGIDRLVKAAMGEKCSQELVLWLLDRQDPLERDVVVKAIIYSYPSRLIDSVARMEWLLGLGYRFGLRADVRSAAHAGRLSCARWLRERGHAVHYDVIYRAVAAGRMEVLQWAVGEMGCIPMPDESRPPGPSSGQFSGSLTTAAADGGHVRILAWLVARGVPLTGGVLRSKHLNVQHWLLKRASGDVPSGPIPPLEMPANV